MLNKQQRNFRKQMMQIQKQQPRLNRTDTYSYRHKKYESEKTRKSFKRSALQIGGLLGAAVLTWNVYALSTYFSPQAITAPVTNQQIEAADQQILHAYIQESSEAEHFLNSQVNGLLKQFEQGTLTPRTVQQVQGELQTFQRTIQTSDARLAPLQLYYEEQFNLAYQVTDALQLTDTAYIPVELQYILNKIQENTMWKQEVLIQLFQTEHIPYELQADGSISYEYQSSK